MKNDYLIKLHLNQIREIAIEHEKLSKLTKQELSIITYLILQEAKTIEKGDQNV